MVFFKTDKFAFNKKSSAFFDLQMCQITESDDMICGLSRNITQSENSVNDIKSVLYVENDYVEISCNMARMKGHKVLPLTDEYMFEINRWLWKKEFLPLEFNGFTLNVMVKSMTKTQYGKNSTGYLTVTFLAEPYMTSTITQTYRVLGELGIELYNKSNVDDYSNIDYIDIELLEGNFVKITNVTTGKKFYLENLKGTTKHIRVLADGYRYVYNTDDDEDNVYAKITKKDWNALKLMYGQNEMKLETIEAKIIVSFKEKIALM